MKLWIGSASGAVQVSRPVGQPDAGEASAADVGIAGGKGEGLLFAKGKVLRKVPENQLVDALFEEIDKL